MIARRLSPVHAALACCLLGMAHGATVSPLRQSLELGGTLSVFRAPDEPRFDAGAAYECVLGRKGQFSIVLPPKGFKATGVRVRANASVVSVDEVRCDVPAGVIVTAGNTTLCVSPRASIHRCPFMYNALQKQL